MQKLQVTNTEGGASFSTNFLLFSHIHVFLTGRTDKSAQGIKKAGCKTCKLVTKEVKVFTSWIDVRSHPRVTGPSHNACETAVMEAHRRIIFFFIGKSLP